MWCMKTDVYSWRVDRELKRSLQDEARRRGESVSALLERVVRDWFRRAAEDDEAEQERLRAAASACFGSVRGGDPTRAERSSSTVREGLRARHGR